MHACFTCTDVIYACRDLWLRCHCVLSLFLRVIVTIALPHCFSHKSISYWSHYRTHGPVLTHWGRVTHICVGKLTIIGSDNGLAPGRHQAIIWTNAGIVLIGPLRTNFNEILIEIHTFSFKKMHLKMSSGKWQPSWLGLNVLIESIKTTSMEDVSTRVLEKIKNI